MLSNSSRQLNKFSGLRESHPPALGGVLRYLHVDQFGTLEIRYFVYDSKSCPVRKVYLARGGTNTSSTNVAKISFPWDEPLLLTVKKCIQLLRHREPVSEWARFKGSQRGPIWFATSSAARAPAIPCLPQIYVFLFQNVPWTRVIKITTPLPTKKITSTISFNLKPKQFPFFGKALKCFLKRAYSVIP